MAAKNVSRLLGTSRRCFGTTPTTWGGVSDVNSEVIHLTPNCTSSLSRDQQGFDTIALHGGYEPDPEVSLGLGQGAPRGIPVHRTTPFVFKNTEHAANLFKLKELGNIYSRLMNPTCNILESRYAQLEGGHPLSALTGEYCE